VLLVTSPRILEALFRTSHPMPSGMVTVAATVMTAVAGAGAGTCVLVAAAVLTGQLSVGWSNDRIDVERDRRVEHEGKPLAAGAVPVKVVDAAIAASVAATCVLSLLLGWRAGGLHLAAVAAAWLYNARLKSTVLSWLPYTFAFAALPAVATLALPHHPAPTPWIVVVTALIGTAVNFTNAKQELADHPRSDVHGLPDRIGGRASLVVAAALLLASAALVTSAAPGAPRPLGWFAAAWTAALLAVGVPLLWRRAGTRWPFYGMLLVAPVQLLAVVVTARPLH
jgi:4-hydroxybenzoate polyprenyltransferase